MNKKQESPKIKRGLIRQMIAKGFDRDPGASPSVSFLIKCDSGNIIAYKRTPLIKVLGNCLCGGIGFICPMVVDRSSFKHQLNIMKKILNQFIEVRSSIPKKPLVFFLGMQYKKGQKELALKRLNIFCQLAQAKKESIKLIGVLLEGSGKWRTLNTVIHLANQLRLDGLGWVDDDVKLEEKCLEQLVKRFLEKKSRGAVGAVKIPEPKINPASRILFHLKNITTPACNYPHGCCILIELDVISKGIPDRYISDDGYICFELLDPSLENPLEYLELVSSAKCRHYVGGPTKEIIKRIRRLLLNHHIFLADYPPEKSKFYFSRMLFYGLWPLAPWDKEMSLFKGCIKWTLKFLYLLWFLRTGVELFFRGLLNAPLKEIPWSGYSKNEVPQS